MCMSKQAGSCADTLNVVCVCVCVCVCVWQTSYSLWQQKVLINLYTVKSEVVNNSTN
jgi:hypothetical protein